jgi:polo-like kinase 1
MQSTTNKVVNDNNNDNQQFIYVVKYLDYTSKYGLGYQLSNGGYGVFFNDSTKISIAPNQDEFCYIEKENAKCFHLQNYPKEDKDINKKVKLLVSFIKYFEEENRDEKKDKKKNEDK